MEGVEDAGLLRSRPPRSQRRSTLEAGADPITDGGLGERGEVRGVRLAAPGI